MNGWRAEANFRELVRASAARRAAQSAAPVGGGLQLVGARCCSTLVANCCCWLKTHFQEWGGEWAELLRLLEPRGPAACPRAARNTPLTRRELLFLPGVRPTKVKLDRVEAVGYLV